MEIKRGLNNPFSALRHRNFALYAMGMCLSLIGTWMQNVAQPLLAYSLTNSAFKIGLISAMQFLPMLLFALFSGVIIDRFSKKKILFFTQSASLIVTLILAILVIIGKVQYWHILIAATFLGIVNTLDMPTRQSFVIELVGKDDLLNAIAINSSVFNVARVVGPGLAGLVMVLWGMSACFLINSISFAAVVISLLFIKPNEVKRAQKSEIKVWRNIMDGLTYIGHSNIILKTLLSVFVMSAFGMNMNVLLTVFNKLVLHLGDDGYGYLMMFMGVGSFIGAMAIASMSRGGPHPVILKYFPYLVGTMLILIAFTRAFLLTGFALAVLGFFFVAFSATANSTVQYSTSDEYRGRVMSVYTLLSGGVTPIGNIYAGLMTDHFGASAGFSGCGVIIIVLLAVFRFLWAKSKNNSETTAQ